jgi:hypothetical protein
MPRIGQVVCSSVKFNRSSSQGNKTIVFKISLNEVSILNDGPGTCWKPLFPSTVMASGFPVPIYPSTRGLLIPFAAMLDMSQVLEDINLVDQDGKPLGIYFDGISYTLYPTALIQAEYGNVIQWHLEDKRSRNHEPPETDAVVAEVERPKMENITNVELLQSAQAILGYCGNVQVQLGTESRRPFHQDPLRCLASFERPPAELSGGTIGVGVNMAGFVNANSTAAWKTRKGLRIGKEEAEKLDYETVLDTTQNEQVILYDTESQNERAWMVSELSLILELFNIWAFAKGIQDIRYANPISDGGAAARAVLDPENNDYFQRVVVQARLDSEKDQKVGDIIKRIYAQIQRRREEDTDSDATARGVRRLGSTGIIGWDWLDLTDLSSTTSYRREFGYGVREQRRRLLRNPWNRSPRPGNHPSWALFTEFVPVFFCQSVGEIITPANPNQLCRNWYPIPGGVQTHYLAASVCCLEELSKKAGHRRQPWLYFHNLEWQYRGQNLFQPCDACIEKPKRCVKEAQVLGERKNAIGRLKQTAIHIGLRSNGAIVMK